MAISVLHNILSLTTPLNFLNRSNEWIKLFSLLSNRFKCFLIIIIISTIILNPEYTLKRVSTSRNYWDNMDDKLLPALFLKLRRLYYSQLYGQILNMANLLSCAKKTLHNNDKQMPETGVGIYTARISYPTYVLFDCSLFLKS